MWAMHLSIYFGKWKFWLNAPKIYLKKSEIIDPLPLPARDKIGLSMLKVLSIVSKYWKTFMDFNFSDLWCGSRRKKPTRIKAQVRPSYISLSQASAILSRLPNTVVQFQSNKALVSLRWILFWIVFAKPILQYAYRTVIEDEITPPLDLYDIVCLSGLLHIFGLPFGQCPFERHFSGLLPYLLVFISYLMHAPPPTPRVHLW